MLNASLARVLEGRALTRQEAEEALAALIDGPAPPEQIGAFLIALRLKPETPEEIAGFVDCLSKRAVPVPVSCDDTMDVCGTGGDSLGTFNVSTTVAFVVAGGGQRIAKHGNRSVSSRCGSFDVLEQLGIQPESDASRVARSIEENGIGFLFAPAFHPALKSLAQVRRNLGVHTVLNAIGPLLNPVPVQSQLVGVYSPRLLETVAHVLRSRGVRSALVVRGEDGLDELSLGGPTRVARLRDGAVALDTITPESCGLRSAPASALKGGDARENAAILLAVLEGEQGPRRDVVLLNAAAAFVVAGKARDLREGMERAAESIDSGRALSILRKVGTKS